MMQESGNKIHVYSSIRGRLVIVMDGSVVLEDWLQMKRATCTSVTIYSKNLS